MSSHKVELMVMVGIVGVIVLALTTYHIGLVRGKYAGRKTMWQEQKAAIGIQEGQTLNFPNGAIMYSDGHIDKKPQQPEPITQGQCAICHRN